MSAMEGDAFAAALINNTAHQETWVKVLTSKSIQEGRRHAKYAQLALHNTVQPLRVYLYLTISRNWCDTRPQLTSSYSSRTYLVIPTTRELAVSESTQTSSS